MPLKKASGKIIEKAAETVLLTLKKD